MKKNIQIINKKTLYSGFYELHQVIFKHRKHDGSWSKPLTREVFNGGHVVTVLPYDSRENKIILIDQLRPALIEKHENAILKEIVAGFIDKNESPEAAAVRECKEETGCDVNKLNKIFSYFSSPGTSNSYYHFFLAEINSFKGEKIVGKTDEDEDILVRSYSITQVKKMLNEGKIINGLTIIALQWFFLNFKKS